MYKDKNKQREVDRERQKRRRDRIKAQGVTNQGSIVTPFVESSGITEGVTFRPDCVTCDEMVDGGNDRAACDVGGCKRGKDIKCFADLPPDVQQTINKMSRDSVGRIDEAEHKKRTAAAIKYQHLFPDRYYPQDSIISSPVCIGKPGDADYSGICTNAWRAERGR